MSQSFFKRRVAIWIALPSLLVVTLGFRGDGQASRTATLALVRTLPDPSATATIVREAGPNGRTIILMREDNADAATLATALTSLSMSREKYGDPPTNELVIKLRGHRAPSSLSADERRLTDAYLSRLRDANPREELEGFGPARTIVVPLGQLQPVARK